MRWPNTNQSMPARPKSKRRLVLDAVIFLILAVVMGWAALGRAEEGRISLRSWPDVLAAEQPGLFWALIAGHWLIVAIGLGLSGLAIRALFSQGPRP